MRAIRALAIALAAVAGSAGAASAQGLVEYALILVFDVGSNGGAVVESVHPSAELSEVCAAPIPEVEPLCAALGELEIGETADTAVGRFFGAGLRDFQFQPLTPAASKPLLIIAEDVEGEALASADTALDFSLLAPPPRISRALFTSIGDGAADLVTCAYDLDRHELQHVVQQRSGPTPPETESKGQCVDAIQDLLDADRAPAAITPLSTSVNALAPRVGVSGQDSPGNGAAGAGRAKILATLVFDGPPGPAGPGPGADADVAILVCDTEGDAGPGVVSLQLGDAAFCDGSSNFDFCDAAQSVAAGQSCAAALAPLLAAGGELRDRPAIVPAPGMRELRLLDVGGDERGRIPFARGTDLVLFGRAGNDALGVVGCSLSGPEPVVTFEQPEPEESSVGEPCAEVIVRGWDIEPKLQIAPTAEVGGADDPEMWVTFTITVSNQGPS